MEWHRNPPWMASTEDKLEPQAKTTSQRTSQNYKLEDKPEPQASTSHQSNNKKTKPLQQIPVSADTVPHRCGQAAFVIQFC